MAHACNLSIRELESGKSGVQGHPQLDRKFKAIQGTRDPVLKIKNVPSQQSSLSQHPCSGQRHLLQPALEVAQLFCNTYKSQHNLTGYDFKAFILPLSLSSIRPTHAVKRWIRIILPAQQTIRLSLRHP